MDPVGFHGILVLLGTAVVLLTLVRFLRLPQILAYLCAGIVVGPHGFGWIPDSEGTRTLAEFGLVFLMFTIGLEFSLPKLMAMKTIVFGLGGAQVLLSCLVFGTIAWWLGAPLEGAIVIGGVLALSSTAIVMKLLIEQLEQNSDYGRHAFGVLLFQDLIVVPFLILIPALGGDIEQSAVVTFGWVLAKSVAVLVGIFLVGRWLLRPLFHTVAAARLREFFMLTVLLITLVSAWLTDLAGLSLALGAFLAGIMLGETQYRHQVESDILPFRDILLGLFFVTIGMLLNVNAVYEYWPYVLASVLGLVVFKAILVMALGRVFGLDAGTALRTGLVLAQGGEFGFALLLQARNYQLLEVSSAQVVLASVVFSMLAAPLLVRHSGRLTQALIPDYARLREPKLEFIRAAADAARGRVIICGYGRCGQNLAWMLEQEDIASIALDLDPVRVRNARDAGKPVVYGDAERRDVLAAAGLERARALVVSFHSTASALRILEVTRQMRPDMPVIVRTMDDADLDHLKLAGATEVVPESLEGSLMIGSHLLLLLGVPVSHMLRHVREVRRDRYRMLRGFFHGEDAFEEGAPDAYRERLQSVVLPQAAFAVDRTLAELTLDQVGATVTSIRHGGIRKPQPESATRLRGGDVVVLYGTPEALERAEKVLLLSSP